MEILQLNEKSRQVAVEKSVKVLQSGGLLIYPTETCYGLGADATSKQAIGLLLAYKGERWGKPISIAVADQEVAEKYVELNALAKNLYRRYLPGPLTVISPSRGLVDPRLESANKTLGLRIPDYPLIREISESLGKPITSTSANVSGGSEPYNIKDLLAGLSEEKKNLLTLILDAGELPRRPPSTVVDTTSGQLVILRAGAVDLHDFASFWENFASLRKIMVEGQLRQRGISDERVLAAMGEVPREKFVPVELWDQAYDDCPLPIGFGQTISQPYVVALACQLLALKGNEKVLDIGTGSGYAAAVLGCLAAQVVSIERVPELAERARKALEDLGYANVIVALGDGHGGFPAKAPFEAINSAAASDDIPLAWKDQLTEGGRIVLPLQKGLFQDLVKVTKKGGQFFEESWGGVVFVPLQ